MSGYHLISNNEPSNGNGPLDKKWACVSTNEIVHVLYRGYYMSGHSIRHFMKRV